MHKLKRILAISLAAGYLLLGQASLAEAGKYGYSKKPVNQDWFANVSVGTVTLNYADINGPISSNMYLLSLGVGKRFFDGKVEVEGRYGSMSATPPSSFGVTSVKVDSADTFSFFVKPMVKIGKDFGEGYVILGVTHSNMVMKSTTFNVSQTFTGDKMNNLSYGAGYSAKTSDGMSIGLEYLMLMQNADAFSGWSSASDLSSVNVVIKYAF